MKLLVEKARQVTKRYNYAKDAFIHLVNAAVFLGALYMIVVGLQGYIGADTGGIVELVKGMGLDRLFTNSGLLAMFFVYWKQNKRTKRLVAEKTKLQRQIEANDSYGFSNTSNLDGSTPNEK